MPLGLELENLELEHLPFSIAIQILSFDQLRFKFYNFELEKQNISAKCLSRQIQWRYETFKWTEAIQKLKKPDANVDKTLYCQQNGYK